MPKIALLIIDMQVGALEWENPPFYQMGILVQRLKQVLDKARTAGIAVFFAQHHNPTGFPAYGSREWELIAEMTPQPQEVVIHKTTPDPFLNTSLDHQLSQLGVTQLVVGGIQTADCIDTACRRAFSLGYQVVLLKDGHTTFDSSILSARQIIDHHNQVMADWFATVVDTEAVEFK
ncbi:isochorismatase family protein [Spirosoma agri]|uniref:Isochorismatase family protein n=1 Tax=Spirosoma agri TaxID=1987381 RepID=A0A6M0IQS5_9BACT|nr:isochorismatase family protein [Spirosoma agri]NEU70638.1 isochorismatase family protein [Spirosoma agri]